MMPDNHAHMFPGCGIHTPTYERIIFFEDDIVRINHHRLSEYLDRTHPRYMDSSLINFIKLIQCKEYFKVKEGNTKHLPQEQLEPDFDIVKFLLQECNDNGIDHSLYAYLPAYCLILMQRGSVYKDIVTQGSIYENEYAKYIGEKKLKKNEIVPKKVVIEIIRNEGAITFLSLIKKGACNDALRYIAEKREDLDTLGWGLSDLIIWLKGQDKNDWATWVKGHFPAITEGKDLVEVKEYNREKVYILRHTAIYTNHGLPNDYRFYILHDGSTESDGPKCSPLQYQFVSFDNSYSRWSSGNNATELMTRCLKDSINNATEIFEFPAHSERYIFEWIMNHFGWEKK